MAVTWPFRDDTEKQRHDFLQRTWEVARKVIEHEDGLQERRLQSLLTLQGFLFASIAVIFQAFVDNDSKDHRLVLSLLIILLGIAGWPSARMAREPIQAAREHVARIAHWWERWVCTNANQMDTSVCFPPIIGSYSIYGAYNNRVANCMGESECEALVKIAIEDEKATFFKFASAPKVLEILWIVILFPSFLFVYLCFIAYVDK